MTLPWFRMDTGFSSHDKILNLLDDRAPPATRWRAAFSYVAAIDWSVAKGTDGRIPANALPLVHGTANTARLLVKHGLWEERLTGWKIHNYERRQALSRDVAHDYELRREAGRRAACRRWHGDDCWVEGKGCSRTEGA